MFSIGRPTPDELPAVVALVQAVVDETYGGLWASAPLPIGDRAWQDAWVARRGGQVAGVVHTEGDRISDLWVLPPARALGIGKALLATAEAEIAARGFGTALLRVVRENARAVGFYAHNGWTVERAFPHERHPVAMLLMRKTIDTVHND